MIYKPYIKVLAYVYMENTQHNKAPCASDVSNFFEMDLAMASVYLRRLWQWGYAIRKKDRESDYNIYRYMITKFGKGRLERSGIEL